MEEAIKKADVLIEALPYIKKFHKKIIVIKYGGSILSDEKIRRGVLEDIVFLSFMGLEPVIVHGGGPNISERLRQNGKKSKFIDGIRVTDEETLEVVEEELRELNNLIVGELKGLGAEAMGLHGKDAGLIEVEKKNSKDDLGYVGEVRAVNKKSLAAYLDKGRVAVVLPMGRGSDGHLYNINADESAAAVASALGAEKMVLLTNVRGIMRNPEDSDSLISTLTCEETQELIKNKVIQEGMIPKVSACIEALKKGVKKTHIIDARMQHALLLEIFTDQGVGTEIIGQLVCDPR